MADFTTVVKLAIIHIMHKRLALCYCVVSKCKDYQNCTFLITVLDYISNGAFHWPLTMYFFQQNVLLLHNHALTFKKRNSKVLPVIMPSNILYIQSHLLWQTIQLVMQENLYCILWSIEPRMHFPVRDSNWSDLVTMGTSKASDMNVI